MPKFNTITDAQHWVDSLGDEAVKILVEDNDHNERIAVALESIAKSLSMIAHPVYRVESDIQDLSELIKPGDIRPVDPGANKS